MAGSKRGGHSKFGTQRHAVVRTTTIKSNGVIIATSPGTKVRAVFEGTVLNIVQFQGATQSY